MNISQYAYGRRFFDPILGRFVCTDPISSEFPSLSTYNYASNNPIINIDLHGLQGVNAVAEGIAGNDDDGYITSAKDYERNQEPVKAAIKDATFFILNFIGLNEIDNAFFGREETTVPQKIAAVLPVLLTPRNSPGKGGTSTGKVTTSKTTTYQTYLKDPINPETHGVYSGRTSGTGSPLKNVAKRDKNHHMNSTHKPAELDKSSSNPKAIRGREQSNIDKNGRAQSEGGTSGNASRGVSKKNKNAREYYEADRREFGI